MKWVVLLGLLILTACGQAPLNETNESEEYGEIVVFSFASTNLTLDDSIIVTGVNTTSTVHLFTYCDLPIALLIKKDDRPFTYVFPHVDECVEPGNTTLTPNMTIPLSSVPTRDGGLEPGLYRLKLFYSTLGPHQHMREHNELITITE